MRDGEERAQLAPWWKTAVVYQIYPRSFADAGDVAGGAIGTLRGITERLDYLAWLGVDAIWISPFYRSPMRDFGYDVADYCDVDPLFGTLADFDALVAAAHGRGIRVIVDWVPAHTSSEHPWFREARASRTNPKRDWYVWRDPPPGGGPPNNWTAAFTGASAWTLDSATGQFYLHSFLPEQPDLNWRQPEVVAAMHEVLRFWLDRGVDGFRADVVHNIAKDPALRDVEPTRAHLPHSILNDEPETHGLLRGIRALLDSYPGDRMMVGEVFLLSTEKVARYYGQRDELHLVFNFPPLFAAWDALAWRGHLDETCGALDPIDVWPTWVLSNHDVPRHRTRYASEARARAAAVLLLTLRGTPFLYMGEELGLEDAIVPPERTVDPGRRDGARAPLPWDATPLHGWRVDPWLPWPPEVETRNVESERADSGSMLHLYRRLLAARRASEALRLGDVEILPSPGGVLVYRRTARPGSSSAVEPSPVSRPGAALHEHESRAPSGHDERIVVVNFRNGPCRVALDTERPLRTLTIEVASDGHGEGSPFSGEVGPDQALVLR